MNWRKCKVEARLWWVALCEVFETPIDPPDEPPTPTKQYIHPHSLPESMCPPTMPSKEKRKQ